jgi:hypothetical protein
MALRPLLFDFLRIKTASGGVETQGIRMKNGSNRYCICFAFIMIGWIYAPLKEG